MGVERGKKGRRREKGERLQRLALLQGRLVGSRVGGVKDMEKDTFLEVDEVDL